jgi:hypothetical protein
VGFVYHDHRAKPSGDGGDAGQIAVVAVRAVGAFGADYDSRRSIAGDAAQHPLEIGDVIVLEGMDLTARELRTFDERHVCRPVEDDVAARLDHRRERPRVDVAPW